ncbi:MAG TPA: 23S rRNA (uracil(1939)-C(5))-methyltransferase, partial [Caldimonas sp.]|nr:23S rRNA (uracil(1939)-C(5))-methyltransferase [Caldimonas sp.]
SAINRVLVSRAVRLLALRGDDSVIDFFCGLGNFTLPLARGARSVLGIEGSAALLERASDAAMLNGLEARVKFLARNLFEVGADDLVGFGPARKWLLDPPREGAFAIVKSLVECIDERPPSVEWQPPERIVYVSCNPATLARDAGLLVHRGGYACTAAAVVNMFPHTAHVESMAVFERSPEKEKGP